MPEGFRAFATDVFGSEAKVTQQMIVDLGEVAANGGRTTAPGAAAASGAR
ncbi:MULTISPECIES: hypothetical protein [unclassified Mesorhizobium]